MLIDVLTQLAADTGYNLTQQRTALLRLAQRSANRMHSMLECNRMYREISLVVPRDALVSLPYFVGELKGMRMHTSEQPFDLHTMTKPRYVNSTLEYRLRNWRDLGEYPCHTYLDGAQQLTIESPVIETTPVELLIAGQTNNAKYIEEVVTITSSPRTTTNMFGPSLSKISCIQDRSCNITIKDSDGVEIAVLYNDHAETRYKIIDVSQVYWSADSLDNGTIVDTCYKVRRKIFKNDADSFYTDSDDYDEAWYHMAMHLHLKPLPDRLQDSLAELKLSEDAMAATKDSTEGFQQKRLVFARNKFTGLFRRMRYYPGNATNVDQTTK